MLPEPNTLHATLPESMADYFGEGHDVDLIIQPDEGPAVGIPATVTARGPIADGQFVITVKARD